MKNGLTTKAILLLITLSAVFGGVYIYGLIYLSETQARIETISKDAEEAKQKLTEVASVKEALSEFQLAESIINNYFIEKDGIVAFVESIEALAKERGVSIKIDQIEEGESDPKLSHIGRLRVVSTVQGSWVNVMRFAIALENLPYQVFITDASFATDRSQNRDTVIWIGSWNISVPKMKEVVLQKT